MFRSEFERTLGIRRADQQFSSGTCQVPSGSFEQYQYISASSSESDSESTSLGLFSKVPVAAACDQWPDRAGPGRGPSN